MTNALAIARKPATAPTLSTGLTPAIAAVFERGEPVRFWEQRFDKADQDAARAALARYNAALRPAPASMIHEWLLFIAAAKLPNMPPTEAALDAAFGAIALVCEDLGPLAFTRETAKDVLSRCKWWPSPAEIIEIIRRPHMRAVLQRHHLESITRCKATDARG